MREIHGVDDAMVEGHKRGVRVIDAAGLVQLEIYSNSGLREAAFIAPEQARFIARELTGSARRVEKAKRP